MLSVKYQSGLQMSENTNKNVSAIISIVLAATVSACDTTTSNIKLSEANGDSLGSRYAATQNITIKYNQVGYLPKSSKILIASAPSSSSSAFVVKDSDDQIVLTGTGSRSKNWPESGESVSQFDVSSIIKPGEYTLTIVGVQKPVVFSVSESALVNAHDAAVKAYYFNRASTTLSAEFAGKFARAAGHPDTDVKIHASAASALRPEGTVISSPRGWYDAGDYNKYIVNAGISTYTLMLAYAHFEDFYKNRDFNIPESNDSMPDLLDEIAWNLDWMSTMQDPNDGGVYHKLTTLNFSGIINPKDGNEQRYVVQKGTAAALNFSAVMAMASRLYQPFDAVKSDHYLKQALAAFQWAQNNPGVAYRQPSDVQTGEYQDEYFIDEFAWASAELYLATKMPVFLSSFEKMYITPDVPSWANSSALGYISLLSNGKSLLTAAQFKRLKTAFLKLADKIEAQHQASAYATAMTTPDFVWGSNGVALNKAIVLFQAKKLTGNNKYQVAGEGLVDYTLGKNPVGISFVTGHGKITPLRPHHRPSAADNVVDPIPGFLVGGPHSGQQDKCVYPSSLPALSYLDDWCSYSTNEVTINWNAPLVYSLAYLQNR